MPPVKSQGHKNRKHNNKEEITKSAQRELHFLAACVHAVLGRDLVSSILDHHSCRIRHKGSRCERAALAYDICLKCSENFARRGSGPVHNTEP